MAGDRQPKFWEHRLKPEPSFERRFMPSVSTVARPVGVRPRTFQSFVSANCSLHGSQHRMPTPSVLRFQTPASGKSATRHRRFLPTRIREPLDAGELCPGASAPGVATAPATPSGSLCVFRLVPPAPTSALFPLPLCSLCPLWLQTSGCKVLRSTVCESLSGRSNTMAFPGGRQPSTLNPQPTAVV
jgi:hypothetical protein